MKQILKRSCFRLKHLAVSLFSMLCFGAAWGALDVTTLVDPSLGYARRGVGPLGDMVVVVFTNNNADITWKAPKNLDAMEFMLVGGGGGGGGHYKSSSGTRYHQAGSGGGGGGVLTGFVNGLSSEDEISVVIGAGGKGGSYTTKASTGAGRAGNGGNTYFSVTNVTYATAYGGGGDGGYDSTGVAIGGSNSGVRGDDSYDRLTPVELLSVDFVGEGVNVSDITSYRNIGGSGYPTASGAPGAGGGGAGEPGGNSDYEGGGSGVGGDGGQGLETDFTGVTMVLGSGGGGGRGKTGSAGSAISSGGDGAGYGKGESAGTDAAANQGGGGGGGSYGKGGGAGGSGIVAFRFVDFDGTIAVDADTQIKAFISDKTYNGEVHKSGVPRALAYTITEHGERIEAGTYTVEVTLKDGYVWADGNTNPTTNFTWQIHQDTNVWTTEGYLSVDYWTAHTVSDVKFIKPSTRYGDVVAKIVKNGVTNDFNGTLPTEAGSYTISYLWPSTISYPNTLYWEASFKVGASETFEGGYKVTGLGEDGNEVALVFTKSCDWTVPASIRKAQYLVVGGGAGGGGDVKASDNYQGGAGGGGGGVVTGLVNFVKGATMAVTIGAGGAGGKAGTKIDGGYGSSYTGGASTFGIGSTAWVTGKGGGRDCGSTSVNYTSGREGGSGGSGGGGRPNKAGGSASKGSFTKYVICGKAYGNAGGEGCTVGYGDNAKYGYAAAGGGGGAAEAGGNGYYIEETSSHVGGAGGEGLCLEIAGGPVVYGSGGGAGSIHGYGSVGGTCAGDGGDAPMNSSNDGTDAIKNQGGGGGGACSEGNGGAGGSGVVVFRYAVYPAAIGDTLYASFEEAFNAAQDGETITLLDNVSISEMYTIGKNLTIDLCGCNISETVASVDGEADRGAFYVRPGYTLTITDSNANVTGEIVTDGGVVIGNYGTVLVKGGIINSGSDVDNDTSVYNFYYNGTTYGKATVSGGKVASIWNCGTANLTGGEVTYIDNSGSLAIADAVTVGSILAKDGTDAPEVTGAGVITGREGLSVATNIDGKIVAFVDGEYTVIDETYVAAIAGTEGVVYYTTIDEALAAAGTSRTTITIIADVELTDRIVIDDGMDITFEGYKMTITAAEGENANDAFYVKEGGKLTLSADLNVVAETYCCVLTHGGDVVTYANLTKTNKTGTQRYSAIQGNGLYDGDVTIAGGTIKCASPDPAIYHPQNGKLTITGGKITGYTAVRVSSGSLKISGGELVATGAVADYVPVNGSSVTETGDALVIENVGNATGDDGVGYEALTSVSITGGTFTSANAEAVASYTAGVDGVEAVTGFISGGTFSTEVPEAYCASGYIPEATTVDGKTVYGVKEGVYVVRNTTTTQGYESFAEAVAAVKAGEVVTLLSDVTASADIAVNVSFELVLGDYGISGDGKLVLAKTAAALTAPESISAKISSGVANYKVVYNEGVYSLVAMVYVASVTDADDNVTKYEVFTEALAAAESGSTVKLLADTVYGEILTLAEGVTLDLNGKSFQTLAVFGDLAMNGGSLKTWDATTQTYYFMAAPAETAGALFWTSDAVLNVSIENYGLVLKSGAITMPNSWRSLVGQSLAISAGASFTIPENVTWNLRGNATVDNDATLVCAGAIALGESIDTIDTTATLTTTNDTLNVVSACEGYKVVYEESVYKLVKAAIDVTIGETEFATVDDLKAAANSETTMTVTSTAAWTATDNVLLKDGVAYATFATYYDVKVDGTSVTLSLVDEVTPVIAESVDGAGDAFVMTAEAVAITINNAVQGLYYGIQQYSDAACSTKVGEAELTAAGAAGAVGLRVTKPTDATAFFRVVVTDIKPEVADGGTVEESTDEE